MSFVCFVLVMCLIYACFVLVFWLFLCIFIFLFICAFPKRPYFALQIYCFFLTYARTLTIFCKNSALYLFVVFVFIFFAFFHFSHFFSLFSCICQFLSLPLHRLFCYLSRYTHDRYTIDTRYIYVRYTKY